MRLIRLEIHTLPGIEPGFVVDDIATGINLVTGPNAIGKSSLIRALGYLVAEPTAGDPGALTLSAVFENHERLTVRRNGSQRVWERDGRRADPPRLPDRDALHCYWLSMEDLLQEDARDERLVSELRRALAGGFDLRDLRGGDFELRPRTGHSEAKALRETEARQRQVESEYHALQRDEGDLPRLERAIKAAREAEERVGHLNRAMSLLEILRQRETIEAGLASFPEGMEHLRGDEPERLAKIAERRDERRTALEAARRQREMAQADLEKTGLGSARPNESAFEVQKSKLSDIHRRQDSLADRLNEYEEAHAMQTGAREALGGSEAPPSLTPEAITRAETLARDLKAKQQRRDELLERIQDAEQAPSDKEITRHALAADALRAWLAATGGGADVPRTAWLLVALGGLAAIAFGALSGSWLAALGGVLTLIGVGWAAWTGRSGDEANARRDFSSSGLKPPASWHREAVVECLSAVDHSLADLRERRARAEVTAEDRRRLEYVARELDTLERHRAQLAQDLGFDPELTAVGIDHFVRQAGAWQHARGRCEGLEQTIARLKRDIEDLAAGVHSFLAEWHVEASQDPETLSAALRELEARCRAGADAERRLGELDRDIKHLEQRLNELDDEERELYRQSGLASGDQLALQARIEALNPWQEQRERLADTSRREAEARRALADDVALLAQVERGEHQALMTERDAAREEANRRESLQKRHTEIETRLEDAGADRRLEQAMSEVDAARGALADRLDEILLAEAGQFLLDEVEAEYRSEHEPEVLRDARERFRRFTHYAWDIKLDEADGFLALDLKQQALRSLSEMSSGTRMQLLLAVRLAWMRRLEQGVESLPLFLDEALTTSDETRFTTVVESLEQIAREEGRQLFYLSARRHELQLWEQATGKRPHHIDLARLRLGGEAAQAGDLVLPETESLPAPDGRSAQDYAAALQVPAVDPRRPEGSLHVFHLLRDDLPLMHRLMENWRVNTLAQLETLLQSNVAETAVGNKFTCDRLAGRCIAARAWIAAWRHGRGRPVDRIALEQSGAVSDAFIDRVADLAESLTGNGAALIAALRNGDVPRFRTSSTDDLEQWLEAEGYIDANDPLDREDRARRTLFNTVDSAAPDDIRQLVAWLDIAAPADDG